MQFKKKLNYIFIMYWFLLTYIVACLIWWFIILMNQNKQIATLKIEQLNTASITYKKNYEELMNAEKRKSAQYTGEGIIFFLVIMAGAIFLHKAILRQLKISKSQQSFMMAVTHELKTPIAVAQLNLETLQKRKLDEAQQQRLIYNALQEVSRLNTLCNNMLLSSQIESEGYTITNEEVDLSVLVTGCVNDFKNRFPDRDFITAIAEDAFVKGDNFLLQMAVNNLIDNAIKYTPKQSAITIVLLSSNNTVTLQVKDEGRGIADAEKNKVFDKFYRIGNTATKSAKGTGLGLYLTNRIVIHHKATISITDNTPTGTVFTINFRASQPKQAYNV